MLESEFNDKVDAIYASLEDQIDEFDQDLDVEFSGSVLTVVFPDGSQVILSRQVASHEIWVAARSGGFHLRLDADRWHCGTTGEDLQALLNRTFTEQLGAPVSFTAL